MTDRFLAQVARSWKMLWWLPQIKLIHVIITNGRKYRLFALLHQDCLCLSADQIIPFFSIDLLWEYCSAIAFHNPRGTEVVKGLCSCAVITVKGQDQTSTSPWRKEILSLEGFIIRTEKVEQYPKNTLLVCYYHRTPPMFKREHKIYMCNIMLCLFLRWFPKKHSNRIIKYFFYSRTATKSRFLNIIKTWKNDAFYNIHRAALSKPFSYELCFIPNSLIAHFFSNKSRICIKILQREIHGIFLLSTFL